MNQRKFMTEADLDREIKRIEKMIEEGNKRVFNQNQLVFYKNLKNELYPKKG